MINALGDERMQSWWRWLQIIHRVWRSYNHQMGRRLHLFRPRRFTEKMQWRSLFDLDPIYAVFSDKVATREYVAQRVGSDAIVPMLWLGAILLPCRSRHCERPTALNAVTAPAGTL
jgi:hypothetical protein